PFHQAAVARLAAALGVEGRAVEQHLDSVAGFGSLDVAGVLPDRPASPRPFALLIAGEVRGTEAVAEGEPFGGLGGLARAVPVLASHLALALHGGVEAVAVAGEALGAPGG